MIWNFHLGLRCIDFNIHGVYLNVDEMDSGTWVFPSDWSCFPLGFWFLNEVGFSYDRDWLLVWEFGFH